MTRSKALAGLAAAVLLSIPRAPVHANPEDGVAAWKDFASHHSDVDRSKWVAALESPESLSLAKRWSSVRGYDAPGLLARANLPAQLKPGLVIEAGDIDSMPWLREYMTPDLIRRFKDAAWFGWRRALIVPTTSYYMSKGTLEQTEASTKSGASFTATPDGNLLAADGRPALATQGALPFLNPKNGLEATWLFVAHGVASDNLDFNPITMDVCNSSNSLERQYKAELWWQKMHGRADIAPHGDMPGMQGVVEAGAIFFNDPRDVRGLAGVRRRYAAANREDDFKVYVPSLKRTRVLSATDGQDPLAAGLELIWDDWRAYWVKTNPAQFDYKIVGESWTLGMPHVGHFYEAARRDGSCKVDTVELELRPVWIVEITDKTGRYVYSKRRIYLDKEFYYPAANEFYDARANLMRVWYDSRDWVPQSGLAQWRQVAIWNVVARRMTWLTMDSRWNGLDQQPTPRTFDIDQLRDFK
jgi:Protein of unknown function (DUF1329)